MAGLWHDCLSICWGMSSRGPPRGACEHWGHRTTGQGPDLAFQGRLKEGARAFPPCRASAGQEGRGWCAPHRTRPDGPGEVYGVSQEYWGRDRVGDWLSVFVCVCRAHGSLFPGTAPPSLVGLLHSVPFTELPS